MNLSSAHLHHEHHHSGTKIALTVSLVLNALLMTGEFSVGYFSHSLSLISDAVHLMTDVFALMIALAAVYIADRPTSLKKSFGFSSVEVLSGYTNSLILICVCGFIAVQSVIRIMDGGGLVDATPVIITGLCGLVVNAVSFLILKHHSHGSPNITGAALHMAADCLGSAGAIVAATLSAAGFRYADPVISLVICVVVFYSVWKLIVECGKILLGFAPAGWDPEKIKASLEAVDGVVEVSDLHLWTMSGDYPLVCAHVSVSKNPSELQPVLSGTLERGFGIIHSTLQLDIRAA